MNHIDLFQIIFEIIFKIILNYISTSGGALRVMDTESKNRVQILNEIVCISQGEDRFMLSPRILSLGKAWIYLLYDSYGQISRQINYLALVRQPIMKKENSDFETILLHLKSNWCRILSFSKGLGKFIHWLLLQLSIIYLQF